MASNQDKVLKNILDSSRNLEKYADNVTDQLESINKGIETIVSGTTNVLSSIDKKMDQLINLMSSSSGNSLSSTLQSDTIIDQVQANTLMLQNLSTKLEKFIKDQNDKAGKSGRNAKDGAEAIKTISTSLTDLIKGLTLFSAIPGTKKFISFIRELGLVFEEIDPNKIEKGAQGVKQMGISIFTLGVSLAASSLLFIVGIPGAIMAATVITALSFIYERIDGQKIEKAGIAVSIMAGSIALVGLALFAFQAFNISAETGLKAILITSGLALVFGLAGKFAGNIALGGLALGLSSLALIGISYGLSEFKKIGFEFNDIAMFSGTMLAVTGIFALAGIPIVAGFIVLGAISLGLASLALIGISYGLNKFKQSKFDQESAKDLEVGLTALTTAFAINPIDSALMIAGSIAIGSAGLALSSITDAVKEWTKVSFTEENAKSLMSAVGSITAAFAQAGSTEGTTTSALSLFTGIDLSPNNVERGIDSVMNAGEAMKSVVEGIKSFASLSTLGLPEDSFTLDSQGKPVQGTLLGNIYSILTAIKVPFAEMGQSANDSTSLIKGIFGADFSESDVEQGIESVKGMGDVMKSVVDGVKAFASLSSLGLPEDSFTLDANGKPIQGTVLGNIFSVTTSLKSVFAEIGRSANEGGSIIKGIFGADFSESDVEQGVQSVQGTGEVIKNIADGLKGFADLNKLGLGPTAFDATIQGSLLWNIKAVTTAVKEIFANIGRSANEGGSLIKGIFGTDFSESDVEQGVESVQGVGDVLKKIADGVLAFGNGSFDATKAAKNIEYIITSIPQAFAKLQLSGDMRKDPKIIYFNAFVSNIERLAKVATPLEKVANSMDKLSKGFGKMGDFFKDFTPEMFKSFADFTNGLVSFSNIETAKLEKNVNSSGPLIQNAAIFAKGNQTQSKQVTQTSSPVSVSPSQVSKSSSSDPRIAILEKQNQMLQESLAEMTNTMKAMVGALTQIKTRLDQPLTTRETKI